MIWSKQSVILAFSLAAMLPTIAPRPAREARTVGHHAAMAAPAQIVDADAAARARAACEIGRVATANSTQVAQLVRLLGDDTRVETPDCARRGWGSFGAEPVVCLTTPGQEAARALAQIGKVAVAPLLSALADPGATVRRHAAVALGLLDDRVAAAPARVSANASCSVR